MSKIDYEGCFSRKCKVAFTGVILAIVVLGVNAQENRIGVPVRINGQNLLFGIDTGASYSLVFRHTAEKLGLEIAEATPNVSINTNIGKRAYTEEVFFELLGSSGRVRLPVFDIPEALRKSTFAEGIIGWDLVRRGVLIFDSTSKNVTLQSSLPEGVNEWESFPLRMDLPILSFTLPSDANLLELSSVFVDTGSTAGVRIHPKVWEKIPMKLSTGTGTIGTSWKSDTGWKTERIYWAEEIQINKLRGCPS